MMRTPKIFLGGEAGTQRQADLALTAGKRLHTHDRPLAGADATRGHSHRTPFRKVLPQLMRVQAGVALLTRLPEVGGAPSAGPSSPPGTLLPKGPGRRPPSGSARPRQRRAGPRFKEHLIMKLQTEKQSGQPAAQLSAAEAARAAHGWLHAQRRARGCRPPATWSPMRDVSAHSGHDRADKVSRNSSASSHTRSRCKCPQMSPGPVRARDETRRFRASHVCPL